MMMALAKLLNPLTAFARRPEKKRTVRLGLAIGLDQVVAVELGRGLLSPSVTRVHARPLAPPDDDGGWPDLTNALKDLLSTLGAEEATASVALMGSLAKTKVVRVPSLRRRDLRSLLNRNIRRYFIMGSQPVLADAVRVERGRRGNPATAVATCAERSRLAVIEQGLAAAGVSADAITAAPIALIEAVSRRVPAVRQEAALIVVSSPGWSEVISVRRGVPWLLQSASQDIEELESLIARVQSGLKETAETTETVVLADSATRSNVIDAVTRAISDVPVDWSQLEELDPAAVAAYGAALLPEGAPLLVSESARSRQEGRSRKRLVTLGAAATILLGFSAALYLVNLRRELEAVASERRAIATTVAQALEMRAAVTAVRERLEAIAVAEGTTVEWTPAFAALARALPDSAYLISMTADGFELRLAGIAATAAEIVPALESSPLLTNVSLNVARRSENVPGSERFDVALYLDPELTSRGAVLNPDGSRRP